MKLLTSLNEVYKTRAWFKNRRTFNPSQRSHEEMEGTIGKQSTYGIRVLLTPCLFLDSQDLMFHGPFCSLIRAAIQIRHPSVRVLPADAEREGVSTTVCCREQQRQHRTPGHTGSFMVMQPESIKTGLGQES